MPQHKSAKKRLRQNIKKKLINSSVLNKYKSSIRDFLSSIDKNDKKQSEQMLRKVNSMAFRAVNKGIIKRRAASRRISSLARTLKS